MNSLKKFNVLSVTALIALLCGSCNFQEMKTAELPRGDANLNGQKGPSDFQLVMSKLLGPTCIGCHNSGRSAAGVNLETCESIVKGNARGKALVVPGSPEASAIVSVITSGRMPPNGSKVSAEVVGLLSAWITAGASDSTWTAGNADSRPNSSSDQSQSPPPNPSTRNPQVPAPAVTPTPGTGPVDPNPTPIPNSSTNYLTVKAELFAPTCLGCHSGEFAEGGVDLSSRDFIVGPPQPGSPPNLVVQGNPDASLIVNVIQTQRMPPQGVPAPSAAALARLKAWILTPEMP